MFLGVWSFSHHCACVQLVHMPSNTSTRWAAEAARLKQRMQQRSSDASTAVVRPDAAPAPAAARDFAVERWLDALGPDFSSTEYKQDEVDLLKSMALTMDRLVDGRNIKQSEVPQ